MLNEILLKGMINTTYILLRVGDSTISSYFYPIHIFDKLLVAEPTDE